MLFDGEAMALMARVTRGNVGRQRARAWPRCRPWRGRGGLENGGSRGFTGDHGSGEGGAGDWAHTTGRSRRRARDGTACDAVQTVVYLQDIWMLGAGARRKAAPPGGTAAPRHHSTTAPSLTDTPPLTSPSRPLARSLSAPPCPVSTPPSCAAAPTSTRPRCRA